VPPQAARSYFSNVPPEASLLPKLREHFAEFLNESCLAPLGLLSLSTCVGFRYEPDHGHYEAFLGSVASDASGLAVAAPCGSLFTHYPADLPTGRCYQLPAVMSIGPPHLSLLRPSLVSLSHDLGAGISTSCPSLTPFGLSLGLDSPHADEPAVGTLRLSGHQILTDVFATYADILTSASSTRPCRSGFSLMQNAPLPHNS